MAAPARAHVSPLDLQVAARALSFLQHPLVGTVVVGIVYVPGNAQSEAEASELNELMGSGFKSGNLTLTPLLIRLDRVSATPAGLYFLTSGVGASAGPLSSVSMRSHAPCVTVDLEQVRSGTCLMGVRSAPKIEILLNRGAAQRADIAFSAVFRMMITEL